METAVVSSVAMTAGRSAAVAVAADGVAMATAAGVAMGGWRCVW